MSFSIASHSVSLITLAVLVSAALWLLTLFAGIAGREKISKDGGPRRVEIAIAVASILFGSIWLYATNPPARKSPAATTASISRGSSCAMIRNGDARSVVLARLGKPDEVRSDAEIRGGTSDVWLYRDSRCAVHFFGEIVEAIE